MCFIIFTVQDFTNKSKGWVGKLSPTRVSHSGRGGMEGPHLMIFFENPPPAPTKIDAPYGKPPPLKNEAPHLKNPPPPPIET